MSGSTSVQSGESRDRVYPKDRTLQEEAGCTWKIWAFVIAIIVGMGALVGVGFGIGGVMGSVADLTMMQSVFLITMSSSAAVSMLALGIFGLCKKCCKESV
jgi:hypothetical protein